MSEAQYGDTKPMSVGDWFITLLVLAIRIVNIIMYLVWALSSSGNVNRKNFCMASLLWFLIIFAFLFLVAFILPVLGGLSP